MKTTRSYSSRRLVSTRLAFRSMVSTGVGLLGLAGAVSPALAADDIWVYSGTPGAPLPSTATTGGGTANWDDGGATPTDYWSLGVKPSTGNNAVINNAGTVNITGAETATDVLLGTIAGGSGNYNHTAGTVSFGAGWFRLGTVGGLAALQPQSTYTMTGGGLQFTGGNQQFNVAEGTFANVTANFSGTAAISGTIGTFNVGRDNGSVGVMSLGAGATLSMNPVGAAGTFAVGNNAGSTGTLNVNGGVITFAPSVAGANNGTNLAIGSAGLGTMNLTAGTVNFQPTAGGYPFAIGRAAGSNGTLTMSGGLLNVGSTTTVQEMWIGNAPGANATSPNGTFNLSGGTVNVSSWFAVGRNTNGGGNGLVNMTGGVLNAAINAGNVSLSGTNAASIGVTGITGGSLNTPNNIYVSEGGVGTLSVSGTGVVNEYGGTGLRINTTATTNTVATGTVNLGSGTAGTAAAPNGLLSVNNVNTINTVAARSIFNFNGGTLQAKYNNGAFFTTGTANVRNGGAVIDSNGVNITIGQALLHSGIAGDNATDGGLIKFGTGALILTNTGNNYTGNTVINAGVVDAQVTGSVPGLNTAGRVTVNSTGILAIGVGYTAGTTLADVDTARASNTFNSGAGIGIDLAAAASPATYATNLTNDGGANGASTGFAKLGAGFLTLTGANTYTGITRFYGGTLAGNIGTGPLVFDGGGWQVIANNAVDYSGRAVTFNGSATIDTNGNNLTFGTPIVGLGGGQLIKQGVGSLTISGGFNFSPTRAYTPGAATLTNIFVNRGTLAFSGATTAVNTGGNYISVGVGAGDQGRLDLLNGATLTTTGDFNVADVGGSTGTTPVNGVNGGIVNLSGTGSALTENSLYVGKGGNAATNGVFAYGVLNQSGGTHTSAGNSQIGAFGLGQYNLSGGTWNRTGGFLSIARQTGGFGVVDVSGTGVFNDNAVGTRSIVGELGTGVLNVRAGGVFNANTSTTNNNGGTLTSGLAALTIGNGAGAAAATPTTGIVNLLSGGTINTQSIGSASGAANLTSLLNFNGGTLKNTVATGTFIQNLTAANVYAGGAVIDTTAGSATIAQPLVAPAGQGVTSIAVPTTGGFNAAIVQITGGGGVGATGIATVDASGNLTGVQITNPGINYATAPTVTVTDAFGTVVTGTATIANNVSGGLTKLGANTLTLGGVNTYTGVTQISSGTLALAAAATLPNTSRISVASGATFDVSAAAFTAGATQTVNGVGTINAGTTTLTLGGTVAPGATTANGDVGTLSFAATNLTLTATTLVQFDIINAGSKDLLTSTTNSALNVNGTLAVYGNPVVGVAYTVASGLGSQAGAFTTVTVDGVNETANAVFAYDNATKNYNVTFSAVPEPSTWALGVFGLGMGALWLRRRRVA